MLNLLTQFGGGIAALTGLGAAAGAQPDQSLSWVEQPPSSWEEQQYRAGTYNAFAGYQDMVNRGPGGADVSASVDSYRNLARMFDEAARTGGVPTQGDIDVSNRFANDLFASRQTALNQSFTEQNTQAERLAARLGRPVNDPILQAKLRTGFMNQQDTLNADKMGFAAQYSMALPDRRLGYASQGANIQGNLAYQAMQNRAALLGLGSQLESMNFNQRTAQAKHYGQSGGGFKGAVEGAFAGLGTAASLGSMFSGMGGAGAAAAGAGGGVAMGSGGGYVGPSPGPWAGGYRY